MQKSSEKTFLQALWLDPVLRDVTSPHSPVYVSKAHYPVRERLSEKSEIDDILLKDIFSMIYAMIGMPSISSNFK